jgi:hypothetical protein
VVAGSNPVSPTKVRGYFGYQRVSTVDQNTARQLDGVEVDKVFTDQASGKDTNRPELGRALDYVRTVTPWWSTRWTALPAISKTFGAPSGNSPATV